MIKNNDLERKIGLKETIVALFKVLSCQFPRGIEENHEQLYHRWVGKDSMVNIVTTIT